MKQYVLTIIKLVLFWLLFFAIGRSLFLLMYYNKLANVSFLEIVQCFTNAFRLDFSTIAYLISFPLFLFSLQLCFKNKIIKILIYTVLTIELLFCSLIIFGEIGIYGEWLCKLNYKVLLYLRRPIEIIMTAKTHQIVLATLGIIFLTFGGIFLCAKFIFSPKIEPIKKWYIKVFPAFLIAGGITFVAMRGGFDAIPITQSAAYFSQKEILNDVAVNPVWNIMHSIGYFSDIDSSRYNFMSNTEAQNMLHRIRKNEKDSLSKIIEKENINVVIILLESWSADLVESLSGSKGITDNFDTLVQKGILFTRTYSNGHRSQQAICSILSGFPSVPMYDITDNHAKYKNLPSLSKQMKTNGYHTSFYFGGNLDYGNIRSFLLHCQFDEIVEEKDIEKSLPRGKLGIHDQYMFAIHHQELNKKQTPFFSILFTLSSHSPYDQPKNIAPVNINCPETPFLNSAKYCDHYLGEYFKSIKNESWYNNTLFILVGDHSHPTHINKQYFYSSDYQHVPMLFFGEVIPKQWQGKQINCVCSHVDIAYSLLAQLNISNKDFQWGKNIFNPYASQYAFFEAASGFGWIRPNAEYIDYYKNDNHITYGIGDSCFFDTLKIEGQAYLQTLYKTYCDY